MYVLKNAVRNIKSSPIRSLILIVIITAISLICCMSLALLRISDKAEKEALSRMSVVARVTKDNLNDYVNLTYGEVKKFEVSEYVYETYISAQTDASIWGDTTKISLISYNSEMAAKYFLVVDELMLAGNMVDFSNFSSECIITDAFSKVYGCETGHILPISLDDQIYEFEIVGIYEGNDYNQKDIIINLNSFETLVNVDDQWEVKSAFVFNNPDYIDPFREYVAQSGEYKAFFSGMQKFRDYFSPIKNTKIFAIFALVLSLFVGGSILIVLSIFNIQERKYEVGALGAVGMPKRKIVTQFVMEILMITLFSMIIGIASGWPLSIDVSRSMLNPTIYTGLTYSLRVTSGIQGKNFGYDIDENSDKDLVALMDTEAKMTDKLKAVMDFTVILEIIGINMLLTIISSFSSIVYVVKFNPLDILNSRN